MAASANHSGYGDPGMGGTRWGAAAAPGPGGPWGYPGGHPGGPGWYWHWRSASPVWIVATLLGFLFWWPVGLVLLFWTIGGRGMSCWGYGRHDGGYEAGWQGGPPPWVGWKRHWKRQMKEWCRSQAQAAMGSAMGTAPGGPGYPSSGNRAFDEYRAETLRRLEDEQKEFAAYLERLRFAKDKAEFDQFMSELRNRPPAPSADQPGTGAPG